MLTLESKMIWQHTVDKVAFSLDTGRFCRDLRGPFHLAVQCLRLPEHKEINQCHQYFLHRSVIVTQFRLSYSLMNKFLHHFKGFNRSLTLTGTKTERLFHSASSTWRKGLASRLCSRISSHPAQVHTQHTRVISSIVHEVLHLEQ